jgi:Ca-activated chloride channel family protein
MPPFRQSSALLDVLRGLTVLSLLTLPACTSTNAAEREGDQASNALANVVVDGAVSFQVIPQYDLLHSDALPGQLDVLIRLQGSEDAKTARPNLDLAIVLDRSGSMSGDKIRAVKQAALDLLKELEEGDHVTLITYSSDVSVHEDHLRTDASGVTALRNHLLPIDSGGGTALGPAVMQTLDLLEARRSKDELHHVILFSDGQANNGEDRPEVLGQRAADGFRHGVSVSTLGVGLDYNEDLMTRLADEGGGRYQFIKDASAIPQVLGDELAGLVSTVASEVEVDITPAEGIEIVDVFGYPVTREDGQVRVRVGSLAAGQTRDIVVRLQLPAHPNAGKLALGGFETRFKPVADGDQPTSTRSLPIQAAVGVTKDGKTARDSERTEVTVRVAEVEAASRLDEATLAVDRGDFDAAKNILREMSEDLASEKAAASSPEVIEALDEQLDDVNDASSGIGKAQASESERKEFSKGYKQRAYKKKKGSSSGGIKRKKGAK